MIYKISLYVTLPKDTTPNDFYDKFVKLDSGNVIARLLTPIEWVKDDEGLTPIYQSGALDRLLTLPTLTFDDFGKEIMKGAKE